jgi:hypothetical protein
MSRTECALVAAGLAGFGLGHYALGWRWLTSAGILLAGVACVWLGAIAQWRQPRKAAKVNAAAAPWVVWIFVGTIILLGIIGLLFRNGILY